MDLGLSGHIAIVFGSTSGLGLATARRLAMEGCSVVFCGRREELAVKAAAEFDGCLGLSVDLTEPDSVQNVIDACRASFGAPDIVVLNSGGPAPGTPSSIDVEQLLGTLQPMLLTQLRIVDAVLPDMRRGGWGRVLAIGSSGVQQPIVQLAQSNIARSALAAYLKSLAGEVSRHGVTANMILPGRISTDRVAQLDDVASKRTGKAVDEVRAEAEAAIPTGRYGRPEEFGDVAAFLCSERASYITGAQIRVDGGLIAAL
jgi:3-oxoacyl-[acyl-carrier protein] reductase